MGRTLTSRCQAGTHNSQGPYLGHGFLGALICLYFEDSVCKVQTVLRPLTVCRCVFKNTNSSCSRGTAGCVWGAVCLRAPSPSPSHSLALIQPLTDLQRGAPGGGDCRELCPGLRERRKLGSISSPGLMRSRWGCRHLTTEACPLSPRQRAGGNLRRITRKEEGSGSPGSPAHQLEEQYRAGSAPSGRKGDRTGEREREPAPCRAGLRGDRAQVISPARSAPMEMCAACLGSQKGRWVCCWSRWSWRGSQAGRRSWGV